MKRRLILAGAGAAVQRSRSGWRWPGPAGAENDYSGTIETREIQIGSKVGGRVTEVGVEEGQLVKAGTIAGALRVRRIEGAARRRRRRRSNRPRPTWIAWCAATGPRRSRRRRPRRAPCRPAYESARNGPRKQEIDQAQADFAAATAESANAETYYKRMEKLAATDTISRQQFDDARNRRDAAAQRAESARQRLALLQAGTRTEDLHAAEAHYQTGGGRGRAGAQGISPRGYRCRARPRWPEAQGHVAELDARLREAELKAPADAVVEVVSVRPGDLVPAGRIVVTMLETSQFWVKVYVPETELAHVHAWASARRSRSTALRGRAFEGHVGQIASQAEFLPRNVQTKSDREHQVFGVKVFVDNPQQVLKSGMSAQVHLE